MKPYMKIVSVLFIVVVGFYAVTHHKNSPKTSTQIMTVTSSPLTTTLYYTGIIQPAKLSTITSMTDGTIEKMLFHYGDNVKNGQLLFILSSEKFYSDYKTSLVQYIKNKSNYLSNLNQLNESKFLHKNQLISDDEYKTKETNFYNSRLEMIESKTSLATMLRRLDLRGYNIYDLKIEDVDKITQLIQSEDGSQRLKILAPATGVILQSAKSDTADGELKKVRSGDQAKLGDVLGIIGDVSRLVVHINVSEFNINQLKLGQKVKVTGAAFPSILLEGEVVGLNRQGESGQNGIPVFPVDITVNNLPQEQQKIIRMGMSVNVAVDVVEGNKITIPIAAVEQKNNDFYVKVKDEKSGKIHEVLVKLGKTMLNSVVVESNLRVGEKIVVTG